MSTSHLAAQLRPRFLCVIKRPANTRRGSDARRQPDPDSQDAELGE